MKNHKAVKRRQRARRHQIKKSRAGQAPNKFCVMIFNLDGSVTYRKRRR